MAMLDTSSPYWQLFQSCLIAGFVMALIIRILGDSTRG